MNNDMLKAGDTITVGKWLKKMGKVSVERGGKPRNLFALCKKGKFVPVVKCHKDEAETIVNDEGKLQPYKIITLDTEVIFGQTEINVFPLDFWKKATQTNLFLGLLEQLNKEEENENKQISEEAETGDQGN